jgi:ABC-type lipoprotein release transport system permease subunit
LFGVGLAIGISLAWLGANIVRVLLFRVEPLDAVTLAIVGVLILTMSLVTSVRPALRVARADVGEVLKEA